MYRGRKIVVVMPAYDAAKTLKKTYDEVMGQGIVELVVVVDDRSCDQTAAVAQPLSKVLVHVHEKNTGYGGTQKSCYRIALEQGADIVIMVHPDYQYAPLLIPAMATMIVNGLHLCVLGARISGGYALQGGMPWWKYMSNRFLTFSQNLLMWDKLSEYHTGYRAYSRELLEYMRLKTLPADFIFDNQFRAQVVWRGYSIGEVSCPTKYFQEAFFINFRRSLKYGLGCLAVAWRFRWHKCIGGTPRYVS
jgi:glycosyltransferase involved in cell wall biosynthesis